jgi:hypothetical protein
MTAKSLERIVEREPFKPYRLVLSDGEQVLVNKPRKSHVSGSVVSLVGLVKRKGSAMPIEKFRIIKVDDVVSAKHVNVPVKAR